MQDVRWQGGDTKPAGEYTFFCGKGKNHELDTDLLYIREPHQQ
jgi:hypothetical protein